MMRLGAFRLGFFQPWIKVYVNGVLRAPSSAAGGSFIRIGGMTIDHVLNHEPDTLSMRCAGFVPLKGHDVKVYLGDLDVYHQLFGGVILDRQLTYEAGKGSNVVYDVNAVDYTWLLKRRRVTKKYTNQSATAIILDLMANYSAGFTTVNVVSGLAVLDEISFTNEELPDCISRVMSRIGGYWYVDYGKDLHAFLTETDSAGAITQAVPRTSKNHRKSEDIGQTFTFIRARGGGSNAADDVAVGSTTLPVDTATWYSASGGKVECGPQLITYTGVAGTNETGSNTGYVAAPPAFGTATNNPGAGSLANGTYGVAMTYVTAEGQTTIGPANSVVVTGGPTGAISLTGIPVPTEPKITDRRIYITDAGGSVYKLFGAIGLVTTAIDVTTTGTTVAPTTNTAGFATAAAAAGSTTLLVEDLSVFPASGWAIAPGSQVFRYTGRSASVGSGTLTGIPASGIGSLTAPVRAGTIKAVPHLTGIPSTGTGSVVYAISKGDPVNIVVERQDIPAQAALAGFVGGDGIHEDFLSDGTLGLIELTARADARLLERKNAFEAVTFETRDPTVRVGRTLSIALTSPAISGTYKIQRVQISELGADGGRASSRLFPLRNVEASTKHWSFEDLLRQVRRGA